MHYNPKIVKLYYTQMGLPEPIFEHPHIPGRQFRLDIAWPAQKIGIEVQGGIYARMPGHTAVKQILRDMEKHNLGLLNGWRVFKITPEEVCQLHTINAVKMLMEANK